MQDALLIHQIVSPLVFASTGDEPHSISGEEFGGLQDFKSFPKVYRMRQTKQELQQKLERAFEEETRLREQIEQREQEFQKLSKSYEEMLSYKNRVIKELRTTQKTEQKEK